MCSPVWSGNIAILICVYSTAAVSIVVSTCDCFEINNIHISHFIEISQQLKSAKCQPIILWSIATQITIQGK